MERGKWGMCLKLFLKFCKIGAFTFGGGYAMIPLIRREIALREGWIEDKDILDILAVSESTPGPIAVNTATFVGYPGGRAPGGRRCHRGGGAALFCDHLRFELCAAPV